MIFSIWYVITTLGFNSLNMVSFSFWNMFIRIALKPLSAKFKIWVSSKAPYISCFYYFFFLCMDHARLFICMYCNFLVENRTFQLLYESKTEFGFLFPKDYCCYLVFWLAILQNDSVQFVFLQCVATDETAQSSVCLVLNLASYTSCVDTIMWTYRACSGHSWVNSFAFVCNPSPTPPFGQIASFCSPEAGLQPQDCNVSLSFRLPPRWLLAIHFAEDKIRKKIGNAFLFYQENLASCKDSQNVKSL